MGVYILNIFLNIVFAYAFLYKYDGSSGKKNKKNFIVIASLQWIIISGLRHVSVGADTYEYSKSFYRALKTPWSSALLNFRYVLEGEIEGRDPGYTLFEKLCGLITNDYQIYLIIIAVIFSGLMGYSVYKNSKDPLISYILYDTLFYAFFSITGLRQTIATAFTVFVGYELIKKRKLLPFVVIVLVVATIHKSALVFLIFYPMYNNKGTSVSRIIAVISIGISFVMRAKLSNYFKDISGYDNYGVYQGTGNAWNFIFMYLIIISFAMLFWRYIERYDEQAGHYLSALLIGAFFLPLTLVNPSAMRIVQYFSLFLMYLLPDMLVVFNKRSYRVAKFGIIMVLVLLLIRSNPTYLFFWQG